MRALDIVIILFLLTQIISLGVGVLLIEGAKENPALLALSVAPDEPTSLSNSFYLLISVLIGAGLILLFLALPYKHVFILFIEFVASVFASFIVFFVFLSSFLFPNADILALLLALFLFVLRIIFRSFRNLLAIISAAGIGAVIAFSIDPFPLFVFVFLLSIYDILAVKWTKHMVKFANYFIKEKTSFSLGFEGVKKIKVKEHGKVSIQERPWYVELGTGDMAVASMITTVSYKFGSLAFPTISLLGSAIGLYIVFSHAAKQKEVMPALPYIVGASLASLLLVFGIIYTLNI